MKQTFTPNDLIRFIYRELSPEEEGRIKNFIAENPGTAQELHLLMESVMELDMVSEEPSETSIRLILEQSREEFAEELHA